MNAGALLAGLLLDAVAGEPRLLWGRLPHPAVMMGRAVAALDRRLNRGHHRRARGVLATALLVAGAGGLGALLPALPGGPVIEALTAAVLLAQRSLVDHVRAVADALRLSPEDGRLAVSRIVGRDIRRLDRAGIARAAIESAAENFADGVVAPAFWFLVGGLPGLMICKIVNTADSMIGYRTPRHARFGWAAARLDDLMNWVPARLAALMIAVAGGGRRALAIARRDSSLHRSPNAGWPEAAMAAALGVALAGPRSYHGRQTDDPFLFAEGRRDPGPEEIDRAVALLWRGWSVLLAAVALLTFLP